MLVAQSRVTDCLDFVAVPPCHQLVPHKMFLCGHVTRFPLLSLQFKASKPSSAAPTHIMAKLDAKGFFIAADTAVIPHIGGLQATWLTARKLMLASRGTSAGAADDEPLQPLRRPGTRRASATGDPSSVRRSSLTSPVAQRHRDSADKQSGHAVAAAVPALHSHSVPAVTAPASAAINPVATTEFTGYEDLDFDLEGLEGLEELGALDYGAFGDAVGFDGAGQSDAGEHRHSHDHDTQHSDVDTNSAGSEFEHEDEEEEGDADGTDDDGEELGGPKSLAFTYDVNVAVEPDRCIMYSVPWKPVGRAVTGQCTGCVK